MTEFWNDFFKESQTSWGFEPADTAIMAKDFFLQEKVKKILIPGIGYGRNAGVFIENGFNVTGIEIAGSAVALAKEKFGSALKIHHGSVTEMPFDEEVYEGIYCYALIHLLNSRERKKFLEDCYKQLLPGAYMLFMVASKEMPGFGTGRYLSKDRFRIMNGLNVFFYDADSVEKEFGKFGLIEYMEMEEPIKHMENEPPLKCFFIKCKRDEGK